jgi:hypothetical protein
VTRKRGQEIFHLVGMLGFIGIGVALTMIGHHAFTDFTKSALRPATTYLAPETPAPR